MEHSIDIGRVKLDSAIPEDHGSQTEYLFSFVNSGEVQLFQQQPITIKANMFTLIPAGLPHKLLSANQVDVWWVSFCPSCLQLSEDSKIMRSFRNVRLGGLPVRLLAPSRMNYVQNLFEELHALKHEQGSELEVFRSLVILLLAEINKCSAPHKEKTAQSDKVIRALDYIQTHFLQPISLKDVAKGVHCSPSYIATLVKQETGYSVGDWLTRTRLTEACSRLIHTQESIASIGEQVGWSDVTHFIRVFKRSLGQTPAAWRKAALK